MISASTRPKREISRGACVLGCSLQSRQLTKLPVTTMTSITFPHGANDHTRSVSTSSSLNESGYFNSFDSASTSSFQMNPLSQHPPRTPRTSVTSASHVYGGDIYTPKEELIEQRGDLASEDDEDDSGHKSAKSRIRTEEIWREMLKTSYGRDKAFVSASSCALQNIPQSRTENYTILFTSISPRAYHHEEFTFAQAL